MLNSLLATRVVTQYELPTDIKLTLINLSENTTYRVDCADGRQWALRLHRKNYHTAQAINSELAWLMALREAGVALTPQPLRGIDGALLQTVQLSAADGLRHMVLFQWEAGEEPTITDNLEPSFHALGEIAARMHAHVRTWQPPKSFTRLTWDFASSLGSEQPHWGHWSTGIGMTPALNRVFTRTVETIEKRLLNFGKGPARFGLVHGDLRLANLLIDDHVVKIMDFDDCGFGWLMSDAATTVSFHEHEKKVPDLISSWVAGYRTIAPLSTADENEIPTFIMLRRLLLVAWLGSRPEIELAQTLGANYTIGSAALCEEYLSRFS